MMRRYIAFSTVATLCLMLVAISPAHAAPPSFDMTGTYTIHYSLGSGVYDHSDTITVMTFGDPGTFSGTGYYVPLPATYTENIYGTLSGNVLNFTVDYTGANGGYFVYATGTIASDGSMSGTAYSNTTPVQNFTWTATGKARPWGYTTAADCGAGEVFVSSLGTPVSVDTIQGHTYAVQARGTFYAGGSGLYDIRADANFSQDRAQYAANPAADWTASVNGYGGLGEALLDLKVDNANIVWGTYTSTHVYSKDIVATDAATSFKLEIYDTFASNNTGGLCVSVTDNDATPPAITITTPPDDAVYVLGQSVAADFECDDAESTSESDVATCVGTVADGAAIDTSSIGAETFTVDASDVGGNLSTLTHDYTVIHDWDGFFRPVDNLPTLNMVKAGQAIPVKFSLSGDQGLNIFAPVYPKSSGIHCDSSADLDAIEVTVAAGGSSLQYEALTDTYTYVWKTDKAWAGTCRQLNVTLVDGTSHFANFKFTR